MEKRAFRLLSMLLNLRGWSAAAAALNVVP
jgi:hypothetical protein